MANEGEIVCVAAATEAPARLRAFGQILHGTSAVCTGTICPDRPPPAELAVRTGGRWSADPPYDGHVPRIR
jgi:hypothetical protein